MIDENEVITLARWSWSELRPDRLYDVVQEKDPEVLKKHEEMVRAYLANDLSSERAIRALTRGKQGMDDLDESGIAFHKHLSDCLKKKLKQLRRSGARRH